MGVLVLVLLAPPDHHTGRGRGWVCSLLTAGSGALPCRALQDQAVRAGLSARRDPISDRGCEVAPSHPHEVNDVPSTRYILPF